MPSTQQVTQVRAVGRASRRASRRRRAEWHSHPGSGYLPHGGEVTDAQRRAEADDCDRVGARPWHAGRISLGVGGAVAILGACVLVASRNRRDAGRLAT